MEVIGEGGFGKVSKCLRVADQQIVAVKMLKKDKVKETERELAMLKAIGVLDPDHINVVKFYEKFEHMEHICLAFEMLDVDLSNFMEKRRWSPLPPKAIRPIAKQLLVALDALKGLGILHGDIKPDNIMLVNTVHQPFRVKLIDFGLAVPASKVRRGVVLQPTRYRAPEVFLGLPMSEAVDMWGLGCLLAFLYLGDNLFPHSCEYHMMRYMVKFLGQPQDSQLLDGLYSNYYFIKEEAADGPRFRLRTRKEYEAAMKVKVKMSWGSFKMPARLDDMVHMFPHKDAAVLEDRRALVDLLKQMFQLEGEVRILPNEALQHPFITMSHLIRNPDSRQYLKVSRANMRAAGLRLLPRLPTTSRLKVAPKPGLPSDPKLPTAPELPSAPEPCVIPDLPPDLKLPETSDLCADPEMPEAPRLPVTPDRPADPEPPATSEPAADLGTPVAPGICAAPDLPAAIPEPCATSDLPSAPERSLPTKVSTPKQHLASEMFTISSISVRKTSGGCFTEVVRKIRQVFKRI